MIVYSTDVFCVDCGDWVAGPVDHHPRPAGAREMAREQGWKRRVRDKRLVDVCPQCEERNNNASVSQEADRD